MRYYCFDTRPSQEHEVVAVCPAEEYFMELLLEGFREEGSFVRSNKHQAAKPGFDASLLGVRGFAADESRRLPGRRPRPICAVQIKLSLFFSQKVYTSSLVFYKNMQIIRHSYGHLNLRCCTPQRCAIIISLVYFSPMLISYRVCTLGQGAKESCFALCFSTTI